MVCHPIGNIKGLKTKTTFASGIIIIPEEAVMAKEKQRFKFFALLMNIGDIAETAYRLYTKVLEISKDPELRSLAAKLKTQIDCIKK